MKAIKSNLKDQILTNDRRIMYCTCCGSEYSANEGDYWDFPENHEFKCCGAVMDLVNKRISYMP